MAEEKIVLKTEVELGNSTNSVKSLKAELRGLTNELANLKPGSQAFVDAAKRAGELKDRIDDAKTAVKAFNPEAKFQAFSNVIGGVANGFAAAQGAMAIFGSENKDLQQMMVRTQGAIALATGLNGLLGMGDAFSNLRGQLVDAVKKLFTLRGALIATGVGAIAVAVGTLVANWKEFSAALTEAFPSFKVVTDFFTNFRQTAMGALKATVEGFKVIGEVVKRVFEGDFSGAIDAAKTFGERTAAAYNQGYIEEDKKIKIENNLKQRKFEVELEEAKGKDVLSKKLALQKDELKLLKVGSDEYNAKLIEIETTKTEIRKKGEEDRKALAEKRLAQEKLEAEAEKLRLESQLDNARKGFKEASKNFDDTTKGYEETRDKGLKFINDENETLEQRKETLDYFYQNKLITEKDYADASVKITKAENDAKFAELDAYAGVLNQASDLLGKNTVEGKAMAIAAATISTYTAIAKTLAAHGANPIPGYAIAQSIVTGIAGLAAVKNIIDTPIPNQGGGGGGGTPSMPSMPAAPAMRPTGFSTGQPSQTPPKVEPQKVYVVESDITNSQNKVARIQSKATIQ
jgi:hypothetical protein